MLKLSTLCCTQGVGKGKKRKERPEGAAEEGAQQTTGVSAEASAAVLSAVLLGIAETAAPGAVLGLSLETPAAPGGKKKKIKKHMESA